jgi:hypothetical protein
MWQVEYTDEFGNWWNGLVEAEQDAIARNVETLRRVGPTLGRPQVDTVNGSRHPNMNELRNAICWPTLPYILRLRSPSNGGQTILRPHDSAR